MRDNIPRRSLNKNSCTMQREQGRKEVEYDHQEQDVIARVEHIQDWFLIGFRLRRRVCVFSLREDKY